MNRRAFLRTTALAAISNTVSASQKATDFRTRGIVITPEDVRGMGWPAR